MAAISPLMLVSAVQAVIAASKAADRAFSQYQRDKGRWIPDADVSGLLLISDRDVLVGRFTDRLEYQELLKADTTGKLQGAYNRLTDGEPKDGDLALLEHAARPLVTDPQLGGLSDKAIQELRFGEEVKQWGTEGGRPTTPFERFALSFADIALGFVTANPSILGVGGNGEKLIGAFAGTLSKLIPDDEKYGPKHGFGQRVLGIVFQSGLETIAKNSDAIFSEKHLQALIENVTEPMIDDFIVKDDGVPLMQKQIEWQTVVDTFLGESLSAAFQTVADHQTEFLGSKFETQVAVGAFTNRFLTTIAKKGLTKTLSSDGLLALYKAALGLVAEQPHLILGKSEGAEDDFVADLLSNLATVVRDQGTAIDDEAFAVALTTTALETLRTNIPALVKVKDNAPLEQVVEASLVSIVSGLKKGVAENSGWKTVLSRSQAIELGRIFLEQTAKTPGLIAGDAKELHDIVSGVAAAMAADTNLLLTGDDWLEIARVAAEEAAANPARLFKMEGGDPKQQLAVKAIMQVLANATTDIANGRAQGEILFGDTLKRAVTTTLRGLAGNLASAKALVEQNKLGSLAEQINQIIVKTPGTALPRYGSKEWLLLFTEALSRSLADSSFGTLIDVNNGTLTDQGEDFIKEILLGT